MTNRIILTVLRVLLGSVFVFSGFVKTIDPLGFTYKIQDYLGAMGALGEFILQYPSLPFVAAMLVVAVELIIGLCLVFGVRLKEATIAAALMMLFMTPLTLWTALADPVHDCGCFGDALVIDNWTTFWKNIVIDVVIVLVFLMMKHHKPAFSKRAQWFVLGYSCLFAFGLSIYCYNRLPLLDFRPYKIGVNIEKDMQLPENAKKDSAVFTVVYEKDGVQEEFALENMPDSTWTFVETKRNIIVKGDEPKIKDFQFFDADGEEVTDIILDYEGYTFLLVSHKLEKADLDKAACVNDIYSYAQANGYRFYAVTSSGADEIIRYQLQTKAEYPMLVADDILLKTIIRSNPGLLLLKNAEILNKWAACDLPTFTEKLEQSPLGEIQKPARVTRVLVAALIYLLPLLLIFGVDKMLHNRRD